MSKLFHYVLFLSFGAGNLILALSRIYNDHLSDFSLGFCEGFSTVLIVAGTIYLSWLAVKRKNPFKTGKN